MNSRLFAAIAAAVGITLSPGVTAGPLACSNYATVAAWAAAGSCVDDHDGDLLLTYVSSAGLFPADAGFILSEIDIGGVDLYNVGFDFSVSGWHGGGSIQYRITSLNLEGIGGANFDLSTMGTGALATEQLFDIGAGNPFLGLTSTDGSRDPPQGETPFNVRNDLVVIDTFGPSGTALFLHADNSFGAVPEPGTLALLALGFAGLAATRPRDSR